MDTAGETNRPFQSIGPDVHGAGTVDGDGVDLTVYRDALVMLDFTQMAGGGLGDVKIQESDDDGVGDAYADVTGAVFTQLTDATPAGMIYARLKRSGPQTYKKFVRAVAVIANAAGTLGVSIVGLDPIVKPDANFAALEFSV